MTILSKSKLALGGLVFVGGLMAGCSGNPPTTQLDVSQLAVNNAVNAGATQFAPQDMASAQAKLRQAKVAVDEKKYEEAKILAEQAEWDARVAERRSQVQKTKAVKKYAGDVSQ